MKKIGITGGKGKLGSLLLGRPNFVSLGCDITYPSSISNELEKQSKLGNGDIDLIVNCAAISSIDECSRNYDQAIKVNVRGVKNLHAVFGSRVLNISSDQVFSGKSWWLPSEQTKTSPINNYGWTKVGAEAVTTVYGGKTIRLSRTVSVHDIDIYGYISNLIRGGIIQVPAFFYRNYIHRNFAVQGIEYFAIHYNSMPDIVHYGGTENYAMDVFMGLLAEKFGLGRSLVQSRHEYIVDGDCSPRPKRGGFKINLAESMGFPMYTLDDTLEEFRKEYVSYHNSSI